MVDPVDGSTVERIKTIKFGYSEGIQPSWFGKIEILDKMRNVVATSTDVTNVIPAGQEDNWNYIVQEVIVSFNNEITAGGNYTVVVPEGFFNLDLQAQGFMVKNNRECSFYLNIEGDGTPSGIANIIGVNGGKADVYTVNGVMVMKGADASALKTLKPGMYIINGKTYMLK